MIPTILQIGPLPIHSFGLMIALGLIAATHLLAQRFKNNGINPEYAEKYVTWAAVAGIFGAKLGYILTLDSGNSMTEALFSGAGFVFYWGLVGGFLAVCFLLYKNKINFLKMGDLVSPPLAIGYAVGRLGCQLSGDGDYGKETNILWGMSYPFGVVPTNLVVHPTPIYESIGALILCFILFNVEKLAKIGTGASFATYLIISSLFRYLVENYRVEPIVYQNFTQAQVTSLFIGIFGVLLLIYSFYGDRSRESHSI